MALEDKSCCRVDFDWIGWALVLIGAAESPGCLAAGLRGVISSGYLSVPRIPHFLLLSPPG